MQLRHLEVGQLFEPSVTHYNEGVKFDFTQGGPILLIFFEHPTAKEVESIRSGKFTMKFYDTDNIIFMFFKFGSLNWMDAPYTVHLSQPFGFSKELKQENIGFGLQIYLVDAATGILKVIRLIGLGHEFSSLLRDAILKQKETPFNRGVYMFKLNELCKRYSTNELVEYAKWFFTTN